jgi:hypothetical protein
VGAASRRELFSNFKKNRHSREGGNPVTFAAYAEVEVVQSWRTQFFAQWIVNETSSGTSDSRWVPAFAGFSTAEWLVMTIH